MKGFLGACAASLGLVALMGSASQAQESYPSRAIRIIVPYAPGGQGDITARLIGDNLAPAIGQPVTVENRAGANGVIGIDALAKSPPDGYTIGVVVASHALSPALIKPLPYDPVSDFTPVTTTAITQMAMVTSPTLEADTVEEFIAYAKEHPGELAYKSAGPGSNSHLFGAWFADAAGIDMIHVPYKGSGDSMPDLMSGVVHMGFDTLPAVSGHIKSGQVKLIAAGGPARSPQYPDVPTVAEAGIEGFVANSWGMVLAPKGTPPEIVDRLNKEIVAILDKPEVKARFETMGADVVGNSPDEAGEMLESEVKLYTDLVEKLKIDVTN
ncbi:tripartite tricarboxylate transporter substrate binding protein [Aquamicrobium sp. LC103]|uniref:Bug family tripartite tricarboxylate transporter substrate binding protein n=1 Tax=Aquamicrobium sp. LC103 TaxID=1120658 RepID=UPI00063E888B|nr:tripartite tricarboxylate transporter substrate binding protein [Aquamicrobium sp. LC103]TKT78339.1 tripartite tricarboxylate transporter substrate binding protein [Aquamicrobium sp. LC103]